MPHLFALDQNFPEPIVATLQRYLEDDVELVPIRNIDRRLPKELSVLCQSRLSLVIAVAAGHDPIKATGLVLAHISSICSQTQPETPQVWRLRTMAKPPEDPWVFITNIANRQGERAAALYERERLSARDLGSDPLA